MSLRARLLGAANVSGGWPYYHRHTSRIEPTSWALLALAADAPAAGATAASDLAPHAQFLRDRQADFGLLVDPDAPVANFAWNGLALLALEQLDAADDPIRARLVDALVAGKGVRLEDGLVLEQDSQLQAWAWTGGTFSWVEPTALCLLALKRVTPRSNAIAARIGEAEAMLLDRVCPQGGWNYGNGRAFDQDLRAYVPTSALALLALQDRPDEPAVRLSLDWLVRHATREASTMALSLAAVCLTVFRLPAAPTLQMLSRQDAATGFLGNAHLVAMAHFAATLDRHDARIFRVPHAGAAARSGAA